MSFGHVARIAGLSIGLFFLPSRAHSELLQAASIEPGPPGIPAPARTDIVPPGKNMTAPILIHSVEPRYPASAQRSSSPEIVIVNCYIELDGTTSNVHAVRITVARESDVNNYAKSLEDSAVEAVKHYKFKPAKKDGKPVPVELNVDVTFSTRSYR
ncbi:energy transducer TonB [Tunturibacter empetritectus]|uniref:Protein TonB n=1 Tax=Tunturiibacter empetritectus TaxID=3069691 RepID=A0A7W8IFR3_9BACT|nr:energy transducer TonB [Edaphobacter lichenicola]MBB5316382.1 protein TonB [Edaphobacter lichenicola]